MSGLTESFYNLTEKIMVYSNMFNILGMAVLFIAVIVIALVCYFKDKRRSK